MEHTYWLKQTDTPLFPDILWSKPESKHTSGHIGIIGGNLHAISMPGQIYSDALSAGAGECSVLLPDAVRKIVLRILPDATYAPSTKSGSFAKNAVDSFLQQTNTCDWTILAGDFGRNSETAMLLERYISLVTNPLTVTQDCVDYFLETPLEITNRPQTIVVATIAQLQKLFINTPTITPILFSMTTQQLVSALHEYTLNKQSMLIVNHNNLLFVAIQGRVSTTACHDDFWRAKISARASVFAMQHPSDQIFEAVTSSFIEDLK